VAPEAIEAIGLMAESRRDVGLLAITSADRLNAGWTAAAGARRARPRARRISAYRKTAGAAAAPLRHRHRDRRPSGDAGLARRCARPSRRPLGVEHFGQTGTIEDLYRHYGIDADAIIAAAQSIAPGRPIRHLGVA
jgi:pyruvate dehydrogenase E1 component